MGLLVKKSTTQQEVTEREHSIPKVPNIAVIWDQFCPGQQQEEGWEVVEGL